MKTLSLVAVGALLLTAAAPAGALPIPDDPPVEKVRAIPAAEFDHSTGRDGGHGWETDHRLHRPGYALLRPRDPLLLEPGIYRAVFEVRRGKYPDSGFLHSAFGVFRLELWDATDRRLIGSRELQVCDFPSPNSFEGRSLTFSMQGRTGHIVEPRVYWPGLVNGEAGEVTIERLPIAPPSALEEKARRLAERIRREHLENGFVVSRKAGGEPDELGDAVTYTGLYATALAWKLSVAKDAYTEESLENAMEALHSAVKGTPEEPIITRFVAADGNPHPKSPSRDVYTSFFLACAAAYPVLESPSLRAQIRLDVDRIATRLLTENWVVRGAGHPLVNLGPHFTADEVRDGISKLAHDPNAAKSALRVLRRVQHFVPFYDLWPGVKDVMTALEKRDDKKLTEVVVPAANGVFFLADQVIRILRTDAHDDIDDRRVRSADLPAKRLSAFLKTTLKKLPADQDGRRLKSLSDLRVLASNALIDLHIAKTAAVITGKSQFETYYRENLYAQDALLKTALDWYGVDDEIIRLAAGNAEAARHRDGYIALLAVFNLYTLEKNPTVRDSYRTLIEREAEDDRLDNNPLSESIAAAAGLAANTGTVLRALTLYPMDPSGFGEAYWREHGQAIAEKFGGGETEGYSNEPLPVSHRPRDSFLWQRNARRLKGDAVKAYPGTDYLFLYWLARRFQLVPAPERIPTAFRRR